MSRRLDRFYLGCYTEPAGRGAGVGILGDGSICGVGATASPSFLAAHPRLPVLYCVNELSTGSITAFRRHGDALIELGSAPTGGADPCHLAVIGSGAFVVATNFTSGSVSAHRLGEDGTIGARTDLVLQRGSGPDLPRWQASAHAHQVVEAPDGSLVVADLGADRLFWYTVDASTGRLAPDRRRTVVTPAGDGPRHLVFHPDGPIVVANQLGNSVAVYAPTADGRYEYVAAYPVAPAGAVWGEGPAELVLSPDARTLYVSHRGANSVAVFTVDGVTLTLKAHVPSGGRYPRHIAVSHGLLYVANRDTDNIVAVAIDSVTGIPGDVVAEISTPSPVCVLPMSPAIDA